MQIPTDPNYGSVSEVGGGDRDEDLLDTLQIPNSGLEALVPFPT